MQYDGEMGKKIAGVMHVSNHLKTQSLRVTLCTDFDFLAAGLFSIQGNTEIALDTAK